MQNIAEAKLELLIHLLVTKKLEKDRYVLYGDKQIYEIMIKHKIINRKVKHVDMLNCKKYLVFRTRSGRNILEININEHNIEQTIEELKQDVLTQANQ